MGLTSGSRHHQSKEFMKNQSEGASPMKDWPLCDYTSRFCLDAEQLCQCATCQAWGTMIRRMFFGHGPSGTQDAPTKNCEHERVDEDGYCRKCGSDTRGGFCLAQDAPQPQNAEEERRNALESLLPGRAANAAQTDWGKGYIEGWIARANQGRCDTGLRPLVKRREHE